MKAMIALCMLALTNSSRVLADTDVQFKGTLISEPCEVATNSVDQTVPMGTIAVATFLHQSRSSPKNFSIRLTGCDLSLGNTVAVTFSGTEDSAQPGTFATTGDAKGIAIALEDKNGTSVKPDSPMKAVDLDSGDVQLDYVAYVQAQDYSKVKEGAFESKAIFYLKYE
jgi:P pilus assembly protein, pilin FimA